MTPKLRPLPPAPWPVEGLTQGAVVLERLVEAVRALELGVWGLKLEQALEAAGMPRVLHRIDVSAGVVHCAREPFVAVCGANYPALATNSDPAATTCPECRRRLAGRPEAQPVLLRVTLQDGEPRYVTSGGLLSRDRSHARIFASEAEAKDYANLHLDPKTERVISAT